LVGRNSFFVLNFGLDIFNSVSWVNFKSNVLASEGLDEDLNTTTKAENKLLL
jgi:hypothetical protein